MKQLDVPLSYIREFIDLSRTLNYTETARRMSISQPSLSRHISIMEKELGVPLFDRSPNSVRLTECGKIVVDGATRALSVLDEAQEAALEAKKQPAQKIVIGGDIRIPKMRNIVFGARRKAATDGRKLLVEIFGPTTSSDINEHIKHPVFDELARGNIDIAVGLFRPDGFDAHTYERLYEIPMVYLAPETSPLLNASELDLVDLKTQTFVFPAAFMQLVESFKYLCKKLDFTPKLDLRYVSAADDAFVPHGSDDIFPTYKSWYEDGMFIEFANLFELPVKDEWCHTPAGIVYRNDNTNPALEPFVEDLIQIASHLDSR